MRFGLRIFLTIFVGLLTSAFPQVNGKEDPVKRVFEVPIYPGTVPFNSNPKFERWHAPFGTSLLVYRTADSGSLDKEKVISFYRAALTNKGWKDHTEARRLRPAAVGDSGGKQILSLPSRGITHIVLKESTVFLIQDYSGKQGESVKHIAAELAKLQSPN